MKIDQMIRCKKTNELFVVTGKSKTHIYFSGYRVRGGIPKSEFYNDFDLVEDEEC